jgi:subtilase family serine protease
MLRAVRWPSLLRVLAVLAILGNSTAGAMPMPSPQAGADGARVTLHGNVHPLAQAKYDQGAVPDSFAASRMLIVLKPSAARAAAMQQFLQDAHTPGNPSYHAWLVPAQFAAEFGAADADVATVSSWLQKQGFAVARVSGGKIAIEFSGTAGQIRTAFNTEIHTYVVNGEIHHANNRDPQIPAELAPLVAGITSLNDFRPKSYAEVLGKATYDPKTHQVRPEWTVASQAFALAPGDFAVQYDLAPLYAAGTNGAGATIGIIGASNVDAGAIAAYRTLFGLPASPLNVIIDGEDPGENEAQIESYLDVEVSGAVAPGATINLYTSAGTSMQYGLNLAGLRAVDDDQASVLSTSYGQCEQDLGAAGNQFWAAVWEQAAAQGQTSFVSAGDGGSAGCDDFDFPQPAEFGLAVNGIASTPWNIAVGGTDFYFTSYGGTQAEQAAELATYWNQTPTVSPAVSLLKPIPEQVWNVPFGLNLESGGIYDSGDPSIVAGSGGASSCTSGTAAADGTIATCASGYGKPAWQTGTGVPADSARDLPDVSLFAAAGTNDSFYPICAADCVESAQGVAILGVGGTSASSPSMAGIMALIDQKFGPQGQANFVLYPLAAQHPAAFHDIRLGSNNVPCAPGSPNCTLSVLTDNTSGIDTLGEYYAGTGYDLATGLGTIDANVLVNSWTSLKFAATKTTLSLSQTSFTHGTPVTVSVGVSGSGGTPSGNVGLTTTASPTVNTGLAPLALTTGSATSSVNDFPGGQYAVTARYAGDTLFATSSSTPVTVNVAPENSTIAISGSIFNYAKELFGRLANGGSYSYGNFATIDAQPTGASAGAGKTDGIATGTVTFTDTTANGGTAAATMNVTATGTAEWVPNGGFLVGAHSVTATYSGDASFNASSTTAPFVFTVTKGTTTVQLFAEPPIIALGTSVTLNVLAIASDTSAPPTGTVTFYSGSTSLGSLPLGNDPYNPSVSTATLNPTTLPLGSDSLTAKYSGDANNNPATSAPVVVTVRPNPNISATVSPNPTNSAGYFTVTATATGVAGSPLPTGGFVYYATGSLGSWTEEASLVNGSATNTLPGGEIGVGAIMVNVEYAGDTNYAQTSITIPVTVVSPFALSGTPVMISSPGATTGNTSTVTLTPQGGFTGPVTFTCTLSSMPAGAQILPTCSIPASVSVTAAAPISATMVIGSTGPTSAAVSWPRTDRIVWFTAKSGAIVLSFLLIGCASARRRRVRTALTAAFAAAMVVGLAACSGSGGGGGTSHQTTPGAYSFTVTATTPGPNAGLASVSATTVVSVTIQ